MMANYENIKEISQRDLEDFLRSIMASNAGDNAIGAAAATLKQEEGFPMFPKLPKELRIEIVRYTPLPSFYANCLNI